MASNATPLSLKGYKHQFVDQPPDDLLCRICLSVARDPQQITCCGKVLCKVCLEKYKNYSNNCPQCKIPIESFRDKRSDGIIKSLKTKCDNSSNGCEWIGELRSLYKHVLCCYFTLLPCPNQCKKDGEIRKLPRKDINKHRREECPRRQYECPHCKETGEYQERTTSHYEKCPNVKIPCPNSSCNKLAKRWVIPKHRNTCPFELLPCKYSNIGCKKTICRKDLNVHEGDSQLHLQLAIDTVHELKGTLAQVQQMVESLKIKFKVTNFKKYKHPSEEIYSPAFYTRPGGYKMCINVIPYGHGHGEGTHVSVYAYLMRGENDDRLPWPFTGTVTVELLNQLEDKNHHSMLITFPQGGRASQRVMDGEISPATTDHSVYISHTDLSYSGAKHHLYLEDDCLYFRVTVNTNTTTSKPWLV